MGYGREERRQKFWNVRSNLWYGRHKNKRKKVGRIIRRLWRKEFDGQEREKRKERRGGGREE